MIREEMLAEYLPFLVGAGVQAGAAILDVYASDFQVQYKDDRSPLTLADRRSHEIISEHLSRIPLERFQLLSEEGRGIPYEERKEWEYLWIVDPLDGTKEFLRRNGEFTVNIALVHRGSPVAGVVYAPVFGSLYFAVRGNGAYRSSVRADDMAGSRIGDFSSLVKKAERLVPGAEEGAGAPSRIRIIGSRSHMSAETEEFVRKLSEMYDSIEMVTAGSSLKFCLVAEGRADVYPRFAPTMEWDTAAGQIIVEEGGGMVLAAATRLPLRYNKENLLNPHFIVIGGSGRPVP